MIIVELSFFFAFALGGLIRLVRIALVALQTRLALGTGSGLGRGRFGLGDRPFLVALGGFLLVLFAGGVIDHEAIFAFVAIDFASDHSRIANRYHCLAAGTLLFEACC